MKAFTKAIFHGIFKIIWITLGVFFGALLLLSAIHAATYRGSGVAGIGGAIGAGVLILLAMYLVGFYAIATVLFLVIRKLIRRHRKKKEKKND